MSGKLAGKTLFITGASRGIGLAIGLRAAADGANVAIAAKTETPHPKLPGTIHSAAAEIEKAGGKALPLAVDIRNDEALAAAIARTADAFGGIDILVNNASAINLAGTAEVDMKRFDLMHQVNIRGTFLASKLALPFLAKSANPHILMIAPPLDIQAKWFAPHLAYSLAKFGMSLCVLGLAAELAPKRIAVNALWPATFIATAAVRNIVGNADDIRASRHPEIMADAAYEILTQPSAAATGQFFIDETLLRARGVTSFDRYAIDPTASLKRDLFLD